MNQTVPVNMAVRRRSLSLAGAVVFLLATAALTTPDPANAAGGGKAPTVTYTGVTASFRCSGSLQGGVLVPSCTDGILGDGSSYVGNPGVSTTAGAFFYTSGSLDDFFLKLDGTTSRALWLDFRTAANPAPCGTGCRKHFDWLKVSRTLLQQGLLVRPANADGSDRLNGMRGIAVGQTVPAKLKVNVPDPNNTTIWWTVRLNTRDYPDTSYVRVTRTALNSWTIEAGGYLTPDDKGIAELVASIGGTRSATREGWYFMPFSLTVVK